MTRPMLTAHSPFFAIALATLTSGLMACSTSPRNQAEAQSTTASPASSMPMDHSTMDHSRMSGMDHTMALGPADADFDRRFIDAMTPHHLGAVAMAREVQQKSQRPELRRLAAAIIKAQTQEIATMATWRKAWYPNVGDTAIAFDPNMGHSMPMTPEQKTSMMMSMDLGNADPQFDLRFINAMIPHHEGALVMAKEALSKSKRPEIRRLAQAILTSQQNEIRQMAQWRKAWYKQ